MSHRRFLTSAAVFIIASSATWACGPNFPWQLLTDRENTLKETPSNSFAFEAQHLLAPPEDHLKANDTEFSGDPLLLKSHPLDKWAQIGLTAGQIAYANQSLNQQTGEAAYAAGEGQPRVLRFYAAGAADYWHGRMPQAEHWFRQVLALPTTEGRLRATWAAFSLAKVLTAQGKVSEAMDALHQTQSLAQRGAPDPEGLAVAAYGDEARVSYLQAEALVHGGIVIRSQAQAYAKAMTNAVRLYAMQAGHGSMSGIDSLHAVVQTVLSSTDRFDAVSTDPLILHLLVVHELSKTNRIDSWRYGYDPTGSNVEFQAAFAKLTDAAAAQKQPTQDDDRLAALAYSQGRYQVAGVLAGRSRSPLAHWVLAKLALQQGHSADAAAELTAAAKSFQSQRTDVSIDPRERLRLQGERAIVALSRSNYADAMEKLYPLAKTYWADVAYIGERVMSTDELKHFVDVRAPLLQLEPAFLWPTAKGRYTDHDVWIWPNPSAQLRDLLARRLVRDGRFQEALPYFHKPGLPGFKDSHVREHVSDYAQALDLAHSGKTPLDQAKGWYAASRLARRWGMTMMGYEASPDYFSTDGEFGDEGDDQTGWSPLGVRKLGPHFVSADERARFKTSAANPKLRFHYRPIAIDEARKAAALLPPQSQAAAAILCQAYHYNATREPETAKAIYQQFLRSGARVDFARHFGVKCPEPNFADAEGN